VVVVLLSCPIIGDYIFIPAVLRRTADLPISFGTTLRKTLLQNLVSRTPVDKPYLWACLNGYRDIEDYQKVIELTTHSISKTDPKDKDDLSSLFYRQGEAYERLNKFEEAIASYSRASDLAPEMIWTLLRRADCFVKMGRPFAALSDLQRVHVLNPLESTAYYLEAKTLLSLNKVQSALDCVDRRIALQNGRTQYSLLLRSTLLEKLGRNAEAKKDLLQVGQLDGEYDKFVRKLLRAVVYERLGDTKNSRKCLASITPADRIDDLQYLYDVDDFTDEIKSMMQRLLPNDETLRRLHLVVETD
jgi:tetratricopeptide (TPR) repeat protein